MFVEGGKIKLIIGPIFSGKSTTLTTMVRKYSYKNKKTILVNHSGDKRYSNTGKIITLEKAQFDALVCTVIQEKINELAQYDVIGIHEGQFFPDLVEQCEYLCSLGKIVIVSGLSGDFKMEPFDNITRLISKTDKVKLLKAYCYYCHKSAGFTLRTVRSDSVILIGTAEAYRPVCKKCHYVNYMN